LLLQLIYGLPQIITLSNILKVEHQSEYDKLKHWTAQNVIPFQGSEVKPWTGFSFKVLALKTSMLRLPVCPATSWWGRWGGAGWTDVTNLQVKK